ncbi:MAG: hypothetical protein ACRDLP_00205 [Solirubrobacteraceae bacterium]
MPRPRLLGSATLIALLLATASSAAATDTTTPCGTATAATAEAVAGSVAANIFRGELTGGEVLADAGRVRDSVPLLAAVAQGNRAAAHRAVHALVYHPLWHIVRLRVLDSTGRVLADIGGPYVIAPVTGTLRYEGNVVGTFVMSVQDDVGFTKLETHAVGDPIAVYYGGKLVAHLGARFPASPPSLPTMNVGGAQYAVLNETYGAFPTGTLLAVILVPPPPVALGAQPCIAVRASAIGSVAAHLATRFHPLDASYPKYVETLHTDTGAIAILRIGTRPIAGSQGIGPAVIPTSGPVTYLGHTYWVFSFEPTPPARVYLLIS